MNYQVALAGTVHTIAEKHITLCIDGVAECLLGGESVKEVTALTITRGAMSLQTEDADANMNHRLVSCLKDCTFLLCKWTKSTDICGLTVLLFQYPHQLITEEGPLLGVTAWQQIERLLNYSKY